MFHVKHRPALACYRRRMTQPRTAAATAANRRRKLERLAGELRAAGYLVTSPETVAEARRTALVAAQAYDQQAR